jgi:hypothetical protein
MIWSLRLAFTAVLIAMLCVTGWAGAPIQRLLLRQEA